MQTTDSERLFNDVLSRAIPEVQSKGIDVFTFAFYHDHESAAVSICVDTESSSARLVRSQNTFRIRHFADAVARGDLQRAGLFNANVGRSISLGDFAMVNVARTNIASMLTDATFYLGMIRALLARENDILQLTRDPQRLLFCSSSADSEVGYMWSALQAAP